MRDLTEVLGREERDDVEWKRDAEGRDLLRKAICALANDLLERGRGHLVVGVPNDGVGMLDPETAEARDRLGEP